MPPWLLYTIGVLIFAFGLLLSIVQSATQIQEFTLSFVPKAVGCGVALLLCGHWMLTTMITFTTQLFHQIPTFASG